MSKLFIISHSQSNGLRLGPQLAPLLQAAYPGCVLLNAAVGGSSIASWAYGQPNYDAAVRSVSAMQDTHVPACIISVIGETDAKYSETAPAFQAAMWDNLGDFRAEICTPYLPVVYIRLGTKPEGVDLYPAWADIQKAQAGLMVNHPAYHMVQGYGVYEPGRPYCHRTSAVNGLQAALVMESIKAFVP